MSSCACAFGRLVTAPTVTLREEFVGFIGMNDVSAESVATEILARISELELDITNCVGQGYEGASTMSGHVSGVHVRIREQAPFAVYVHCASHCLNLVLNHSSQTPLIRRMFTILSDVINFFSPAHVVQWSNHLGAMCSRA